MKPRGVDLLRAVLLACAAIAASSCGGGGTSAGDSAADSQPPDAADAWEASDAPADTPAPDATPDAPPDSAPDAEPDGIVPPACPLPGDVGAGDHLVELPHGGLSRSYRLHVPGWYSPSVRTPLVVNIHGLNMTSALHIPFTRMNSTADSRGFVALYPEGYEKSWNAGVCCGAASDSGIDDVGFLRAVVADVGTKLCIDSSRVYAAGMSNGGHMSHRLACEANDLFAAFAPVSGSMTLTGCSPGRPVPIVGFHGVDDYIVFYSLGEAAMNGWVARNGCAGDPVRTNYGAASYCDRWDACDGGVSVVFCTLDPMGHCWPDGNETMCFGLGEWNGDVNANEYMWDFFTAFTL
jgi:polyhydroxybutyrate depolymerase